MLCECGSEWKVQENLSGYKGEVVLVCDICKSRYYNAQEFFDDEKLAKLERIIIRGNP